MEHNRVPNGLENHGKPGHEKSIFQAKIMKFYLKYLYGKIMENFLPAPRIPSNTHTLFRFYV